MGMDYVGRDPASEAGGGFHLNWSGHTYMAQLLDMIGADLMESGWSGSNDGDEVDGITATEWADLIDAALDAGRIKERKIPDTSYGGGFRMLPHVEEPTSTQFVEMYERMEASFRKGAAVAVAEPEVIEELSEDTREWIRSFATFLRDSGGFAQY